MSYTLTRSATQPERVVPDAISAQPTGEATAVPMVATVPAIAVPTVEAHAASVPRTAAEALLLETPLETPQVPELPDLTARAAPGRVFLMPRPSVSHRPRSSAA